jgi:hypothetical protein
MLTQIESRQLTFKDGRYYYADNGDYYPSVTTLLEAYPKPYQLLQWMKEMGSKSDEIRDAAGQRGSTVHNLTELYDDDHEISLIGDHGQPQYSLEEWKMFERYADFSERYKPAYSIIEKTIISPALGYAGTIDRVGVIEGKKYLIDIKTSNGIYNSYWLQLAAYRELLMDQMGVDVDGVAILWLNAKTRTNGKKDDMQGVGWQMITRERTEPDFKLFEATKALWLAEHGEDKPKHFSYQLTYKRPL